jgi:branched-chain amino acid transport system substrate-binding protein
VSVSELLLLVLLKQATRQLSLHARNFRFGAKPVFSIVAVFPPPFSVRGPGMSRAEITVGLSISLSGRFQLQGQHALNGHLLWQSYINGLGGIAFPSVEKRSVRLIWYDDRSQISGAKNNVLRLLQQDRADVLFGPYSSSLTMAVAPIAEEHKTVLWNSGGTSDEIFAHGWRYLVGVASPASHYLRKLPRWLAEHYPALVRICVLYSGKGTFGLRVARGILDSALAVARHSVHLVPVNVPWENHDTLLGVLSGIAPDVVVLSGSFQDEVSLLRTRSRWPSTVGVVATVAAGLSDFFTELAQAADGVVGSSQWEQGVTFPDIAGPGSDWFLDNFRAKFGQAPDYIAAGGFATGLVLSECIQRCSSLDNEKLRETASKLECNTFYGRFRIDSRTGIQTGHNVLLIRWRGGRKMLLLS